VTFSYSARAKPELVFPRIVAEFEFVYTQFDSYSLTTHTHAGVYEPADSTILKDADIGVNVEGYVSKGTAWNKAFGTGSTDVATGDHSHSDLAPLASPTFTGTVTVPTLSSSDVTTGTGYTDITTFNNSWVNHSATYQVSHRIMPDGVVRLKGLVKDGTFGATSDAFTLPSGSRPSQEEIFVVRCSGGEAEVRIRTSGTVVMYAGVSNAWVSLSNLSFVASGF
jgi:hypothetical protein